MCCANQGWCPCFRRAWVLIYSSGEYPEETVIPREGSNGSGERLGRDVGSRYSDPSQDFRKGAIWESFLEELEGKDKRDRM